MDTNARIMYDDIIDHDHYVDPDRPQMSRLNRAAQFSPFAALTGYEDLIDEAARQTSTQIELDDSTKEEIARRLNVLLSMENPPTATVTFFVQDAKKSGGAYETTMGIIRRYSDFSRLITMDNGMNVCLDDVSAIQADCFNAE